MTLASLKWAWQKAAAAPPEAGFSGLKARMQLLVAAFSARQALSRLIHAAPATTLHRLMEERPEAIGAFVWPFQNADWDATTRWRRIEDHCAIVDSLGRPFNFHADQKLELASLPEIDMGLRLIVDQPFWFLREGILALNLFVGDFRAFSLAFSFCTDDDAEMCAYIGAVQGRSRDDALDTYRDLTKALFGMRPRDFLIESFRMMCAEAGVKRIFAVADQYRHHRHPYFGNKTSFPSNYDEIWSEREGVRLNEQTFELPIKTTRRALEDIKPKKRSMYRKRYDFLDQLNQDIVQGLAANRLVLIDDQ